jgi:hypothetical protein
MNKRCHHAHIPTSFHSRHYTGFYRNGINNLGKGRYLRSSDQASYAKTIWDRLKNISASELISASRRMNGTKVPLGIEPII